MTRPAKIALAITAALTAVVVAACGVALALRDWVPGLAGCADPTRPPKTSVFTEKARIEQMYPQLRPIQAVHWQEREARARSCPEIGPMEYELSGLAVLTPAVAAGAPAGAAAAASDVPDIPPDLLPFAPPAPHWRDVGGGLWLDPASATVYFTRTSSRPPSSPGPSWPGRPSSPPSPSSPSPS